MFGNFWNIIRDFSLLKYEMTYFAHLREWCNDLLRVAVTCGSRMVEWEDRMEWEEEDMVDMEEEEEGDRDKWEEEEDHPWAILWEEENNRWHILLYLLWNIPRGVKNWEVLFD